MRAWIGIYPGKLGAAAVINCDGQAEEEAYAGDVSQAAEIIREWKAVYRIQLADLERVHSMPGQGVKGVLSFGENFGVWQGSLQGWKCLSSSYVSRGAARAG